MILSDSDAPTPTDVVHLDGVRKIYPMGDGQVAALANVSMRFQRGSFWAIMGPSGSGKSTMLNMIGCLDRPTSGRCFINGSDTSDLPDDRLSELRLRTLGFVFQNFNLIPQLSVTENIQLPLFYLGWDTQRSAERGRQLAETVGLAERLNHRPTELSGGQQQRVAIARALANDPPILLADEPTGNLDSTTGNQILQLLESLHREGRTIILVTHETEVARRASGRLHMLDGKIDRVN